MRESHRARYYDDVREQVRAYQSAFGREALIGPSLGFPFTSDSPYPAEGWIQASLGRLYLRPTDAPQAHNTGWHEGEYFPDEWAIGVPLGWNWHDLFGLVLSFGIHTAGLCEELRDKLFYFEMNEGRIPAGAAVSFGADPVVIYPDLSPNPEQPDPWRGDDPDERFVAEMQSAQKALGKIVELRDILVKHPEIKSKKTLEDAGGNYDRHIGRGAHYAFKRIAREAHIPERYKGLDEGIRRLIEDLWRYDLKKGT